MGFNLAFKELNLISLQYWLSFINFLLGLYWVFRFTFLTHFGNKSQCCWRGNYISCVIITPM